MYPRMGVTGIVPVLVLVLGACGGAAPAGSSGGATSAATGSQGVATSEPATPAATASQGVAGSEPAAGGGHLVARAGSGPGAINETVDGPDVHCLFAEYAGGKSKWNLSYLVDADALKINLTSPNDGPPFGTVGKGETTYAADNTGKSTLKATVTDKGSEVDFIFDGKEFGGSAMHVEAQCQNVTRAK